jgi:hypothetical protein
MLVQIKDIKPNPFRRIEHYPIIREKVEALKASYEQTGYWDNILGRVVDGKVEQAYGHHRVVALRECYGKSKEVEVIVKPLSDENMIRIMANENMEEWGSRAIVEIETVYAVVQAYAEGRIELRKPHEKANRGYLRYAPGFILGDAKRDDFSHAYTAETIGRFLGWIHPGGTVKQKVDNALSALQFIEEGLAKESTFAGINTSGLEAVVREIRRAKEDKERLAKSHDITAQEEARREKEAEKREKQAKTREEAHQASVERFRAEERRKAAEMKAQEERVRGREKAAEVGATVSKALQTGKIGYQGAREEAAKLNDDVKQPPPDLEDYLRRTLADVNRILRSEYHEPARRLDRVVQYKKHLDEVTLEDASKTLWQVAARAAQYANQLWVINKPNADLLKLTR